MSLPSLKAPISLGVLPQREGVSIKKTTPESPQVGIKETLQHLTPSVVREATSKVFRGIGDFGKTVGQSIARSFIATGVEIVEGAKFPTEFPKRRPFGVASYTPIGNLEREIFGTSEPINFRSVGDDMLAIGGEDFKQKWGNYAIPLGMVIAGLDITPIGWGKKSAAQKAAKVISKTDKVADITKVLKPLFKNAPDDKIKFLARGLKNITKEDDALKIISQAGNMNIPTPFKPGAVLKPKPPVKIEADAPLYHLWEMHKNISAPPKMTIPEARKAGIALRVTKGGTVKPAIRRSGVAVPEEFATYQNFRDVKAGILGGSRDITRAIQEIDGALPLSKRVKLPGQAGVAERFVLWRTRDITKMRMGWLANQEATLKNISKGISDKDAMVANKLIERISRKGAHVAPEELVKNPAIAGVTTDTKIIKFAQNARKYFDKVIKRQNDFRELRNQKLIPYRDYYSPHEIQKTSLWERAFGLKKEPRHIFDRPELPDYIKPDKPFNPRELAREAGLPDFMREMNLKTLLENYSNTAARDIFNTSIVQNNKAFAQQLEAMGYLNSSRLIQDWTAEAFAGVKGVADRAAALGPTITRGMSWWRQGLIKSVFPLNFAWNSFIQTSSGVLTTTKYGVRNSTAAMFEWVTSPTARKWVKDNAYSYMVKTGKAGKITQQDINRGMARAVKIEGSKLDTAIDAANYLTEWTEKHLTGWSVLSAKKEGAKRGLTGKALIEFASDGGAKTQSMYNLEDLPGILRNETIKTAAPFQTFHFEAFNNLREFAGKTGIPPSTATERIKMILRFLGGAYAVNTIGQATTGRQPWEAKSFVPFYSLTFEPLEKKLKGEAWAGISTRNLPAPLGIAADFFDGANRYLTKGDISKLRNWGIKYIPGLAGIPGGLQASRVVDGLIAISEGGVKDSAGRILFPIHTDKDKIMSIFSGPWTTEGGKQYWEERERSWLDLFERFREEPKEKTSPPGTLPSLKAPLN